MFDNAPHVTVINTSINDRESYAAGYPIGDIIIQTGRLQNMRRRGSVSIGQIELNYCYWSNLAGRISLSHNITIKALHTKPKSFESSSGSLISLLCDRLCADKLQRMNLIF